ncbi:MAG: ABC transporter ATP-binding protein [Myxococcales bacterium]|nr:ABC transporter ATP-binding protein [Myxococcales bacterium]
MIQVRNLTRYYGEFAALQEVSFDLKVGEIVGLLGLNGAGKSTTLKMLAGLIAPSAGTVTIEGKPLHEHPETRAKIGYLPEDPPLYVEMTVVGFLRHMGRMKGMSGGDIERRLPEVIKTCDLAGREHQVIGTLSHGYRKRVGIAQAIIHDPMLVILDEPISGLDPAQIVEMRKVIRNLGSNHAIIVSSHILSEVSATCDRILVIGRGRLVAEGTESELVARSGGQDRLVVTVRGAVEPFEAWLKEQPEVTGVQRKPAGPGLAAAQIDLQGDVREALLPRIAAAGYGLRLVEAPTDELEEIFLGLAKGTA